MRKDESPNQCQQSPIHSALEKAKLEAGLHYRKEKKLSERLPRNIILRADKDQKSLLE